MKAEELRIGNYVKIDTGFGKVVSLMSNTFCNECANDDYNITIEMEDGTFREEEEAKVEGIPLTEEFLLTCGIEYTNPDNKLMGLISMDDDRGNMYRITYFDNEFRMVLNMWNFLPLKYVHELQNLFFLLTKKELNINYESLVSKKQKE